MFSQSDAWLEWSDAQSTWFSAPFKKVISFSLGGWLTVAMLAGIVFGALLVMHSVKRQQQRNFTSGGIAALVIAFAFERVLSWNAADLDSDALPFLTTFNTILAALFFGIAVGMLAGDFLSGRKTKISVWSPRALATGAMCMALTTVLSRIRFFTMPNGGSVTPASMLPLMLFAYIYGVGPGALLGMLYGLMDYAFGGWFLSLPQVILDYPVAFSMIALAGCFRNKSAAKADDGTRLFFGVILACVGRFIVAVLAGVVFWAGTRSGWEAWSYSLLYNGTYMSVECLICVLITLLIGGRVVKAVKYRSTSH